MKDSRPQRQDHGTPVDDMASALSKAQQRYWYSRFNRTGLLVVILLLATGITLVASRVDSISVNITPAAALETAAVTRIEGIALKWKQQFWVLDRQLTIQVDAPGFIPQTIAIPDPSFTRGAIDIIMLEQLAQLKATTEPSVAGTQWYLNGTLAANGSVFTADLNAGTYELSAQHPYYKMASTKLIAERGGRYAVTLALENISSQVNLTSIPSGASVSIDSKIAGNTPISLTLNGGNYALSVSQSGYDSQFDTLQIRTDGAQIERSYTLIESLVPVAVTVSPAGGDLILNGKALSLSQLSNLKLPPDSANTISYYKPGYIAKEIEFTARRGAENALRLDLREQTGIVDILSVPNADIAINGQPAGRTPAQLTLQSTAQEITLTAPGFMPAKRTVTPSPTQLQSVSVVLESIKDNRIRTRKTGYLNSVGIEMKLFDRLGSFVQGSPRGERHRRANETEQPVRLSRPFYAGVYEVTVDQFFAATNTAQAATGNTLPMTGVTWGAAAKYCNWLSRQEGLQPVYAFSGDQLIRSDASADGYRLLTEAEWEWLARAANRRRQTVYPWGDASIVPQKAGNLADESARGSLPKYIENYRDGFAQLTATGNFPAEKSGLHDLTGNVTEWVHDPYAATSAASTAIEEDPFDESGNVAFHTIKGSNWRSATPSELRAAWRKGARAAADDLGFRVARYLYRE